MGWSTREFLDQFVFLGWIDKVDQVLIIDHGHGSLVKLFVKMQEKIFSDNAEIERLNLRIDELQAVINKVRGSIK